MAHAIQEASGETGVPIAFGVLTTDTWDQAEERAGRGKDNKGFEAAAAAIEMAQLFRRWHPVTIMSRVDPAARHRAPGSGPSDAVSV